MMHTVWIRFSKTPQPNKWPISPNAFPGLQCHGNALVAGAPTGGAYSAPPVSLGGFEGAALPPYAYKSAGLL